MVDRCGDQSERKVTGCGDHETAVTDGGTDEPASSQDDDESGDGRMSRRTMLAAGGGAVLLGGGGFFVWDTFFASGGDFDASDDDPVSTLEEYVSALNEGDFESAEGLLHSEVDANIEEEVPAGDAGASLITITIEESEVVEQTDDRAVVAGEIAVEIPLQGKETQQGEMVLRKEGGVWKIYRDGFLEIGPGSGGDSSETTTESGAGGSGDVTAPDASFETHYHANANEVHVTHQSGDAVPDTELFIDGKDLRTNGDGEWYRQEGAQSEDGGATVSSGVAVTVGAETDAWELRVVWEPLERDVSEELARASGPEA